ncbi:MAG: DUF1919 domain-containing protein [bacterium]|nr:DUF1919 domain-containing protein [bacterium]
MLLKNVAGKLKRFAFDEVKKCLNSKISNKNISIVSNNCASVFLYKYFGCKYLSLTINLQMSPTDFVKFSKNLKYYLSVDIEEVKNPDIEGFKKLGGASIDFPVGKLDDLIIYFQHYSSFDIAKAKWEERKSRINYKSMFFIMIDTFCDKNTVLEFLNLPYEHKLFLTERKDFLLDDNCCLMELNGKPWYQSDWIKQCNFRKRLQTLK